MNEIKQLRTHAGLEYMERQWTPEQARTTAATELTALQDAWRTLAEQAVSPDADWGKVEAEALRLIADTLTAHRSAAAWAGKGAPMPAWTVEDGQVVLGDVRIPLTADLLADWMKGEVA